jgi:Peptidase M76 family
VCVCVCVCSVTVSVALTCDSSCVGARRQSEWGLQLHARAAAGQLGITGQHQKCVRRRAELSVAMNPACRGPGAARSAVDACFDDCFRDTAPFDRIP